MKLAGHRRQCPTLRIGKGYGGGIVQGRIQIQSLGGVVTASCGQGIGIHAVAVAGQADQFQSQMGGQSFKAGKGQSIAAQTVARSSKTRQNRHQGTLRAGADQHVLSGDRRKTPGQPSGPRLAIGLAAAEILIAQQIGQMGVLGQAPHAVLHAGQQGRLVRFGRQIHGEVRGDGSGFSCHGRCGNHRALSHFGNDQSPPLRLGIGPRHGAEIQTQHLGQNPLRRQGVLGLQFAQGHIAGNGIDNFQIGRFAVAGQHRTPYGAFRTQSRHLPRLMAHCMLSPGQWAAESCKNRLTVEAGTKAEISMVRPSTVPLSSRLRIPHRQPDRGLKTPPPELPG